MGVQMFGLLFFTILFITTILCRSPVNWSHCNIETKKIGFPSLNNKGDQEIEVLKFEAEELSVSKGDIFKAYITTRLVKGSIDRYGFPNIKINIHQGKVGVPEKTYKICRELTPCPIEEGEIRIMEIEYEVPPWIPSISLTDPPTPWTVVAEIKTNKVIECITFDIVILEKLKQKSN